MFSKIKEYFASQLTMGKGAVEAKYIAFQCCIIFISLGSILMLYDFLGGIIVASLGASSFILFATPHTNSSRAINLVGSYIFGAFSGIAFSFLHAALLTLDHSGIHFAIIIGCASSAALTTFLMVKTGLVHPPAAALALGLAADPKSLQTGGAAIIGVIILCLVRYLLRKKVKNLI
jgi:CBS-domain-containing membrane protein